MKGTRPETTERFERYAALRDAGVRQYDAAREAGVSQSMCRRYERRYREDRGLQSPSESYRAGLRRRY